MVRVAIGRWEDLLSQIDKEDIYKPDNPNYGLEHHPHITVLFGLEDNVTGKELKKILKNEKQPKAVVTALDCFFPEDFDVVKFSVKSEDLKRLHDLVADKFPFKSFHKDYHPHITLAYVKKGKAKKYELKLKEPVEVRIVGWEFSDKNKNKTVWDF